MKCVYAACGQLATWDAGSPTPALCHEHSNEAARRADVKRAVWGEQFGFTWLCVGDTAGNAAIVVAARKWRAHEIKHGALDRVPPTDGLFYAFLALLDGVPTTGKP